uniref:Uncharacterized protein n=1 Tax=Magallana gigas TaxID=29159 RepID=K1P6V3_MAGGI
MTESPDADCHMIKVESKEAGKGAIFKVLEKQNTGDLKMAGIENMDEFDAPCHMTAIFCNQLAEEDYEKQTVSETERALENLISYMEKNPQVYKKILKKKMKEEKENEGPFSFLKVKMMTLIKGEENVSFVSDRECDQRLEELKTGMSKAFDYNLGNDEIRKAVLPKCNVSSV